MAKLIINPNAPTRFETALVRGGVSIGRDPSNDLVLPDAMVSRRHAVVEYRAGRYTLRDCNSSNGSLVNGDRVFEQVLQDGDVMAIGSVRLMFRDDPQLADASGKVLLHPAARRLVCSGCDTEFRAGDSFCRQCGRPLESAPPPGEACARCHSVVRRPARYCSACGTALEEQDETPAAVGRGTGSGPRPSAALGSGRVAGAAAHAVSEPDPEPERRLQRTSPPLRSVRPLAEPARLGERALAGMLDLALVGVGQALLLAPLVWAWTERDLTADVAYLPVLLSVLAVLATGLAGACYFIYFWGSRGATPGKRALGLAVQGVDGRYPIGLPRAALRLLGYLASGLFLGVGFLMIALDGDALHDRLAATRVVRGRS